MLRAKSATCSSEWSTAWRNSFSSSAMASAKRVAMRRNSFGCCSGALSAITEHSSFDSAATMRKRSSVASGRRTLPVGSRRMLLMICRGKPQVWAIAIPRSAKAMPSTCCAAASSEQFRCSTTRLISALSSGK
ncbi:MAG: hypothetical protein AW07_00344 [Candidatus Accumulibacter sp. SK-11]|nr:MAG: hypothetical protein AW07_00344 [Candidatus Accumulibacter sp. SK-11]